MTTQAPDPNQIRLDLEKAMTLHQRGHMEEAEAVYRQVLSADPDNPDAMHLLGLLAAQSENLPVAVDLIGRAIFINPAVPTYYLNLGNVLRLLDRPKEAIASYERALDLAPDMPEVLSNIGTMHQQDGRLEEAENAYRRALAVRPDFANALYNLGILLRRTGRFKESAEALRRLLEIQPNFGAAYENLGRSLYRDGRFDEAATAYAEWLRIEPDNPIPRHMHAALTGKGGEDRAPDGYVRMIFDQFAHDFDEVLAKLDYQAPKLIEGAVARWLAGQEASDLDILDAGCGTGLCGLLLKPRARKLTGVDLSPGMIEKAQERGVYDELVAAELGAFFTEPREPVDLIVSGDTLVYFGALDDVVAGMARTLRPGGALVASFEALDAPDKNADYLLNVHGRYGHDRLYLRRVLEAAGLTPDSIEDVVLRREAGAPVHGFLITATRR